jgi:hypothetical protein
MAHRHLFSTLLLAAVLLAPAASAQTPAQPPLYPIPPNADNQSLDGLAVDANGYITFLWTNLRFVGTASQTQVFTRRVNSTGLALGPATPLEDLRFDSFGGTVVANQRGDVLMTWGRKKLTGSTFQYFLRRTSYYARRLNLSLKGGADIAVDRAGEFVAVWLSPTPAGYRIFGQRYNVDGTFRGPEFSIPTTAGHSQSSQSVAMNPQTGEFVVVWEERDTDGTGLGVFGQRFGFTTGPQGGPFDIFVPAVIDRPSALQYFVPQVARADNGHFTVIWRNPKDDGNSTDILGQRYDTNGLPLGAQLTIVANADIPDSHPQIAMGPKGDFVVAWDDQGTSPAWFQLFHPNGVPAGPVMVEPATGGATFNGSGRLTYGFKKDFVYGWTNYNDNGTSGNSIAYQRYNQ